jgi:2-oxoacid:acceptor oxidoreductase delta subunit (pyruvate/2-ketoisovalerate family)
MECEYMGKITTGAINPEAGSSKKYKTGSWRNLRPVIHFDICNKKCLLCYQYCPEGAVEKTKDGPRIKYAYCKGCGICAHECTKEAISMEQEEK